MADIFNDDFRDFLRALRRWQVEYLLVGGYSVILHGYSRTTGDLDVWVNQTSDNYRKLTSAFHEFGMPVFDMTEANFLSNPEMDVFRFGRPPVSIDILVVVKGLVFDQAYAQAVEVEVEGLPIKLIHFDDLLRAKQAAGRPRDQNDIDNLKKSNRNEP